MSVPITEKTGNLAYITHIRRLHSFMRHRKDYILLWLDTLCMVYDWLKRKKAEWTKWQFFEKNASKASEFYNTASLFARGIAY